MRRYDIQHDEIDFATLLRRLRSVVEIAEEARRYWDADHDMRAGKILTALSGNLPGYRADIDEIHSAIAQADKRMARAREREGPHDDKSSRVR